MHLNETRVALLGVCGVAILIAAACDDISLCGDSDGDGSCDRFDACPYHAEVPLEGDVIRGTMLCTSPDGSAGPADLPLASFPIEVSGFGRVTTDCNGEFAIPVEAGDELAEGPVNVGFWYDNPVAGWGGNTTRLRIIDDLEVGWGTGLFHFGFDRTVEARVTTDGDGRRELLLDPVVINTSECEMWRIGTEFLDDFHEVRHAPVPGEQLQFMRRSGVFDTTPYVFYDHVDLASNILDLYPWRADREYTMFHESAHIVRDVYDGDEGHWHGDNVNFIYARCHTGLEIFEEPYVFHEGWAGYWARARHQGRSRMMSEGDVTDYCGGAGPRGVELTDGHLDWVEGMVADRLLDLSECVGLGDNDVGDARMLRTLEDNRGSLHSLYDFETALCAAHDCCGLERAEPPTCPPTYSNDGLTCRGPDSHVIRHYRP